MNTVGYFEIQSSNPPRELAFYKAIFGWTFSRALPPDGSGTNAFVCSVQVASFDRMADTIINHGGRIAMPKFAIPGRCWQGYFPDPDYNVFGIFEVDEQAGRA